MNGGCSREANIDQAEVRFLIEKNADGIIVVDEAGSVLFANPAAEQLFGRGALRLIGTRIGVPMVLGETTDISILRPDGGSVDAEVRVVATTWNGQPARLASLRDVSERRITEERLRHSAKMEAVGRLTAGIAHDFNNILTVVLGNLDNARRRLSASDAGLEGALHSASSAALRAAQLTERLLAFARRKPLEPRLVDVNVLVTRMSDLLRRSLGESVTVHTRLADELWNVTVDPTELEAAILNLAVNARDAMPGGGSLTIRTENVPAEHRSGADDHGLGHCMLLRVSDTGCGMTEDEAGQAFEPFFTTKSDGQGTGLGLSHVYGFVKQSGGDVRIESRPGQGTTVKVYLPRCDDADSQRGPAVEVAPVDTHRDSVPTAREGETVLVVEDDPEVRRWTVGILEELGYRVLSAGNADEALTLVAREPGICLLLTDLGLPGGTDGKELAERAHSQREDLRVLITTGYAGDALVREGRLEPGVELLNKPFTRTRLGARIREVLDADGAIKASGHLLVVDDDPMVRFFIGEMLTNANMAVVEAESVREALEKFRADPARYAAAILDFNLPDGSGRDLLGRFRELREDLPVILATGYPPDMIEPPVPEGALTRFLVKPFQFEDLVAALQRVGLRGLPRS